MKLNGNFNMLALINGLKTENTSACSDKLF